MFGTVFIVMLVLVFVIWVKFIVIIYIFWGGKFIFDVGFNIFGFFWIFEKYERVFRVFWENYGVFRENFWVKLLGKNIIFFNREVVSFGVK